MDRLDFDLLSALFRAPRQSYEALGETVNLSGNAVKARLRRLEQEGVLQGFAATPSPAILGLAEGILVFNGVDDLETRGDDLFHQLPDVPGVRFVDVTMDHAVVLWLYARDDSDWERIERAAISLVGKPPTSKLRLPMPEPHALTHSEWRVARALAPDGRMPLKEVVRRSNVSFKTVKRHVESLLARGLVRIEPVLSPSEASGCVLFSLLVQLREGAKVADLRPLLPETTIVTSAPGSRFVVLHVQRRSLREAMQDHRAVKASAAAEQVIFEIATRRRAETWLEDAMLASEAAMIAPPRRLAPLPRTPR